MLGGMNGLAPKRVKTFAELVFLSLIGGVMSCFARACITSLLYEASGEFHWGDVDISIRRFYSIEGKFFLFPQILINQKQDVIYYSMALILISPRVKCTMRTQRYRRTIYSTSRAYPPTSTSSVAEQNQKRYYPERIFIINIFNTRIETDDKSQFR